MKKINAWQVRIIALGFLVIFVGSSSQVLANTLAAANEPQVAPINTIVVPTHYAPHIHHVRRAGVDTIGGYILVGKR